MEEHLCNTTFTGKLLLHLLKQSTVLHRNGHHLTGVEASVVGEGQGFTSKILRVHLKWSNPSTSIDLPKSVIVKVIGSTALGELMPHVPKERIEALQEQLYQAHNIECVVYEMDDLKTVVPMPLCYGKVRSINTPGIMVLEDLGDRAVVKPVYSWGTGMTEAQLDHILIALANVHAWSVNHNDWRQKIPPLDHSNVLVFLFESLVTLLPVSKQKFPSVFKHLDESNVKERINNETYVELFGCDPKSRYNLPSVLVHGDMHIMNIMFDKNEDGFAGEKLVALIDWQVCHQGCAAEDLARVLIICLSTEQRRRDEDKIIGRYVELYNARVLDAANRIIFDDMKRAVREMFAFCAIMWTSGMAMLDHLKTLIKGFSEEETQKILDRILSCNAESLNDALEILKW